MKYVTYQIDDKKIEFHNSIFGNEVLVLNGEKISEKFSFFGTEHYFKIGNNNYSIRPNINFVSPWGIGFKINKNGLPMSMEEVAQNKNRWSAVLYILACLVLGFIAGYFLITIIK